MIEFMSKWGVVKVDMLMLLNDNMGIPFHEVSCLYWWSCARWSCEGPKWNLIYKVVDWVVYVVGWVKLDGISVFRL